METGETVDRKTRVPAREQQRVVLSGTDQRITSGPVAIMAAFKGRIHGCTRTLRRYVRFLLHRGRRPYMAEQSHRLSGAYSDMLRIEEETAGRHGRTIQ